MAPSSTGGPGLCVFVGVFSVPITDYRSREETEQGLSGSARAWGTAADMKQGRILSFCYFQAEDFTQKKEF